LLVVWLSSDDLYLRVELALVSSSIVALVSFAISLRTLLRQGAKPDDVDEVAAVVI
jgi:hypothetical protein